jgi:hypothetical protein
LVSQVQNYTGDVPFHVFDVVRKLLNLCTSHKLSEIEMEKMLEDLPPDSSVVTTPGYKTSETMNLFCSMLLANHWHICIPMDEIF